MSSAAFVHTIIQCKSTQTVSCIHVVNASTIEISATRASYIHALIAGAPGSASASARGLAIHELLHKWIIILSGSAIPKTCIPSPCPTYTILVRSVGRVRVPHSEAEDIPDKRVPNGGHNIQGVIKGIPVYRDRIHNILILIHSDRSGLRTKPNTHLCKGPLLQRIAAAPRADPHAIADTAEEQGAAGVAVQEQIRTEVDRCVAVGQAPTADGKLVVECEQGRGREELSPSEVKTSAFHGDWVVGIWV